MLFMALSAPVELPPAPQNKSATRYGLGIRFFLPRPAFLPQVAHVLEEKVMLLTERQLIQPGIEIIFNKDLRPAGVQLLHDAL